MKKWLKMGDVIDAGPMAELFTGIEEFCRMLDDQDQKLEKQVRDSLGVRDRHRLLWPTNYSNNTLSVGRTPRMVLNPQAHGEKVTTAPVTQVYCPGKNTLEHHKRRGGIEYGDGTFRQMEIIDDLKAEAKKVR